MPGEPSGLMMPFESRFQTDWPACGAYPPNTLSNVWFSPTTTMTCWIGVRPPFPPCGPAATALAGQVVARSKDAHSDAIIDLEDCLDKRRVCVEKLYFFILSS